MCKFAGTQAGDAHPGLRRGPVSAVDPEPIGAAENGVVIAGIIRDDQAMRREAALCRRAFERQHPRDDLPVRGIVGHAEATGIVIRRGLEVAVLRRAKHSMPRAVGVFGHDEITVRRHETGQRLPDFGRGGTVALGFARFSRQDTDFGQAFKTSDVVDRQLGQIGLAEGAVRPGNAAVRRREQIRRHSALQQIGPRIAARIEERCARVPFASASLPPPARAAPATARIPESSRRRSRR